MTNANDPINALAWIKRADGVPELNTDTTNLTKREYFAALALQGILASPKAFELSDGRSTSENGTNKAELAVILADKLIIELNK